MRDRFRGFLPVVVDIETGGFNCQTDAILEIAMTLLTMSEDGQLEIAETHSRNVEPFEGANLDPSALEFTGIDPESPLRGAVPELNQRPLDVVLSDMAPNMSGLTEVDQPRAMYLVELATELARTSLAPGGA